MRSATLRLVLVILAGWCVLPTAIARADVLRVPEEYATIAAAVAAAADGDTIRVGSGTYCEVVVLNRRLDLKGEGAPTVGDGACPAGIRLQQAASGTTIRHFVIQGVGPGYGVLGLGAHNVVVEQNTLLGDRPGGVLVRDGSGWTVSYNRIEGFREIGIDFLSRIGQAIDNTAMHNVIVAGASPTVPPGSPPVNKKGIRLVAQDGATLRNNRLIVSDFTPAPDAGIMIADFRPPPPSSPVFVPTINSVVVNNDGRDSEVAVLVIQDRSGGDGNLAGTVLRGNFGTIDLAGDVEEVTDRAVDTLLECDAAGTCSVDEPPPGE